jgi:hypothetical protein
VTQRELWLGIRRGLMLIIGAIDQYFGVKDSKPKT